MLRPSQWSEVRVLNRRCRFSIQPLTILGVTGPFSVLAENIYSLCTTSFNVSRTDWCLYLELNMISSRYRSCPSWPGH